MNPERIEELLRKTSPPKAPADLLQKLTAGIRLPQPAAGETSSWQRPPSWFRRWLPALSFAGLFLACAVVLAVQTNTLNALQQKNAELQVVKDKQPTSASASAAQTGVEVAPGELERLRKDNTELVKLQAEIAQLNTQLQAMPQLQTENQRLKAQAAAAMAARDPDEAAMDEARKRAQRIQCVNNLKQIGLAGRLWSSDNADTFPMNFISMTNELSTWRVLQCPGDHGRKVSSWADVEAGNISYLMDATGIKENGPDFNPNIVFVECPIHHNICLMDGSVQQLSDEAYRNKIKMIDGKKVFVP